MIRQFSVSWSKNSSNNFFDKLSFHWSNNSLPTGPKIIRVPDSEIWDVTFPKTLHLTDLKWSPITSSSVFLTTESQLFLSNDPNKFLLAHSKIFLVTNRNLILLNDRALVLLSEPQVFFFRALGSFFVWFLEFLWESFSS